MFDETPIYSYAQSILISATLAFPFLYWGLNFVLYDPINIELIRGDIIGTLFFYYFLGFLWFLPIWILFLITSILIIKKTHNKSHLKYYHLLCFLTLYSLTMLVYYMLEPPIRGDFFVLSTAVVISTVPFIFIYRPVPSVKIADT